LIFCGYGYCLCLTPFIKAEVDEKILPKEYMQIKISVNILEVGDLWQREFLRIKERF